MSSNYKPEVGKPTTNTLKLSNEDMIFKEIRSKPYESLGFYFTDKALQFEAATDKNQNKSQDLKELQESVQKIKALNIPVAKPLCDIHNNICYYMKKQNVVLNTK